MRTAPPDSFRIPRDSTRPLRDTSRPARDTTYAAVYYPWIRVLDPATQADFTIPSSGHVAGIYARTWLQAVGVWDDVHPHVVPTLDVRAALAAVDGGHADAGIVYRTDAATTRGVRVALEVPPAEGPKIVYPVAALTRAKSGARELASHLASAEARPVYARYGFVVLGGK